MTDDQKPKAELTDVALEKGAAGQADTRRKQVSRFMRAEQNNVNSEPTVDQEIQDHIGRKLKEVYDDLASQPVPDRFRQLLDELERKEKKQ